MEWTRRMFLRTAAPVAVATVAPAAALTLPAIAVEENPALLRLGVELDALHADFLSASKATREARAVYDSIAPQMPAEMLAPERLNHFVTHELRDPEGWPVETPDRKAVMVHTVHSLEWVCSDYGPRSKVGKEARHLLAIARPYEARRDEALRTSGLGDAVAQCKVALSGLQECLASMGAEEARTARGVAIKARAIAAFATAYPDPMKFLAGGLAGASLAEDFIRIGLAG